MTDSEYQSDFWDEKTVSAGKDINRIKAINLICGPSLPIHYDVGIFRSIQ